jgi:hypothetical protein
LLLDYKCILPKYDINNRFMGLKLCAVGK